MLKEYYNMKLERTKLIYGVNEMNKVNWWVAGAPALRFIQIQFHSAFALLHFHLNFTFMQRLLHSLSSFRSHSFIAAINSWTERKLGVQWRNDGMQERNEWVGKQLLNFTAIICFLHSVPLHSSTNFFSERKVTICDDWVLRYINTCYSFKIVYNPN